MRKRNLALISHQILQELLGAAQSEDLEAIVELVATKMEVSVCSCYLLRSSDLLELVATYGLNPISVGKTFLRLDEGVVGEVATSLKVVNLKNAWKSENFSYHPETDEKDFKSFLGVPIMHKEQLLGVLCIQDEDSVKYQEEEVELLKTISLLIAEILVSDTAIEDRISVHSELIQQENVFYGYSLASGLGIGKAVLHRQVKPVIKLVSTDIKAEESRLKKALSEMQDKISQTLANLSSQKGEHIDILSTYFMFSNDKSWVSRLEDGVRTGLTAEASAQKEFEEIKRKLENSTDEYLKARIVDFEDLTNRLISHLSGNIFINKKELPEDIILCAQNMGPSELFDYELQRIKGIVLEEGSRNMHIAIIARSLRIPILGGLPKILKRINRDDDIIIDSYNELLYINPTTEIEDKYKKEIEDLNLKVQAREKIVNKEAITKDGQKISLNINVGLAIDMDALEHYNADGVGLYRSELGFMLENSLPDIKTQEKIYRDILTKAKDKPVIFRTMDIGSDKVLQYFQGGKEDNPAMGWRSIRISLDRKAMFRHQLKAMIRAGANKEIHIMFPMISTVSEFKEAKRTLEKELEKEKLLGNAVPKSVKIGTMLEVPALIFQLKDLLAHLDFVSIGTNDLMQFIYACDRGNMSISQRYDVLSPAMIEVLRYIQAECKNANVECSICGEMAGNPLDAMVLIGLGFRKLSLNPFKLISIKEMVLSLDTEDIKDYLDTMREFSSDSMRELFKSFARDHEIKIDNTIV